MKIYDCPDEVEFPKPDYANYDPDMERQRQDQHMAALKKWLTDNGYTGPYTGKILRMPHADGCAYYMMADGPTSCLVHLPYGDGWDSPNAQFLPKKEVIARIKRQEGLAKMFEERA